MSKTKDQQIKQLKRQIEALKSEKAGITSYESGVRKKSPISAEKPAIRQNQPITANNDWLNGYVRKGLTKSLVVMGSLLALLAGLYLTQKWWWVLLQ